MNRRRTGEPQSLGNDITAMSRRVANLLVPPRCMGLGPTCEASTGDDATPCATTDRPAMVGTAPPSVRCPPHGQPFPEKVCRHTRSAEARAHDKSVADTLARRAQEQALSRLRTDMQRRGVPQTAEMAIILRPTLRITPAFKVLENADRWREANIVDGRRPGAVVFLAPNVVKPAKGSPCEHGGYGAGKSIAGGAYVTRHPSAIYVTAWDIAALPDSDWSDYRELRRRWEQVEFLYIDEIGVEWSQFSARSEKRLMGLIHTRYNAGLFTAGSTNWTYERFERAYFAQDDVLGRFMSRLENEQFRMDVNGTKGGLRWWNMLNVPYDLRSDDGKRWLETTCPLATWRLRDEGGTLRWRAER